MNLFNKLFQRKEFKSPEDYFAVTITDVFIKVEHPNRKTEMVLWGNIREIKMINTDKGPLEPDVFLLLIGTDDGCLIPQGAKGFEEVFDIVSKYEGFDFENFIKSMACADNAEFHLWSKK